MEYPLMEPNFEIKPFKEMNKKDAQQHFEWYVNEIPNRINLLKKAYETTGGGETENLDLTPKSLIRLWEWFISKIEIIPKTKDEMDSEIEKAPEWLKEKIKENNQKLSIGTITLTMDIAIYFAEIFVNHYNNIKWGFVTKPKTLAYINRPVLVGFSTKVELDPRNIVYNLTLKTLNGDKNPNSLYDLYNIWKMDV